MKHLRSTPAVLLMSLAAATFSPNAKADDLNSWLTPVELATRVNTDSKSLPSTPAEGPFDVVSALKSIGIGGSTTDSFGAALTLSLGLSLMGAIVLAAGMFGHSKRSGNWKSASWSRFQSAHPRNWRGATGSSYDVSAHRSLTSRG